jgi:bisphosphoglycerate-dependent phosphoglycerate mutase
MAVRSGESVLITAETATDRALIQVLMTAAAHGGLDVDLPVDMAPNWTLAILAMGCLS